MMCLYLASVWGYNEESLNGVFAEESVSLVAEARLHLVISIQTFQRCLGDMNLPVGVRGKQSHCHLSVHTVLPTWRLCDCKISDYVVKCGDWPRQSSCLHHVGQCDVIGPDIILPLSEPQNPAQYAARMQTHTHVQVHLGRFRNRPDYTHIFTKRYILFKFCIFFITLVVFILTPTGVDEITKSKSHRCTCRNGLSSGTFNTHD